MSSMLKKKGALSFKPKAPQVRRPAGQPAPAAAPAATPDSSHPSAEQITQPHPKSQPQTELQSQSQVQSQPSGSSLPSAPSQALPLELPKQTATPPPTQARPETQAAPKPPQQSPPTSAQSKVQRTIPQSQSVALTSAVPPRLDHINPVVQPSATTSAIPRAQEPRDIQPTVINPPTPVEPTKKAPAPLPKPKPKPKPRISAAQLTSEVSTGEIATSQPNGVSETAPGSSTAIPSAAVAKPKRVYKRKKKVAVEDGDAVLPSIETPELSSGTSQGETAGEAKPPRKRKKREVTPEDAEEQTVDHTTMKMAELCRDLRIGKKFSKHDEIRKRDKERKAASRLSRLNQSSERDSMTPAASSEREGTGMMVMDGDGPQLRIVDGEIVVDDRSLVVNRHQRAAAVADDMEVIEENDFTRITTSGTFMKRESSYFWNAVDTDKFYRGLRMFGADFGMIAMMFPGRTRKQVKLKFNKEERAYPKKVEQALQERIPVDMDEYMQLSGVQFEEVADIEAERAKVEQEFEAEERRQEEEQEEIDRQKRAAIQAGSSGLLGKENHPQDFDYDDFKAGRSRKKGASSKKRNLHSIHGGGEEVEVLGTI